MGEVGRVMAQNGFATTAAEFEALDEQTQSDLKHGAWSEAANEFVDEFPDRHELLDEVA